MHSSPNFLLISLTLSLHPILEAMDKKISDLESLSIVLIILLLLEQQALLIYPHQEDGIQAITETQMHSSPNFLLISLILLLHPILEALQKTDDMISLFVTLYPCLLSVLILQKEKRLDSACGMWCLAYLHSFPRTVFLNVLEENIVRNGNEGRVGVTWLPLGPRSRSPGPPTTCRGCSRLSCL